MAARSTSSTTVLEQELTELAEHPLPFIRSCRLSKTPFHEQTLVDFAAVDPSTNNDGTPYVAPRSPPIFNIHTDTTAPGAQQYLSVLIKPTKGTSSSYDHRVYPIHLSFTHRYPLEPPRIRWACVMNHSQVDPLHFCDNVTSCYSVLAFIVPCL
jgi:hypothetical protein